MVSQWLSVLLNLDESRFNGMKRDGCFWSMWLNGMGGLLNGECLFGSVQVPPISMLKDVQSMYRKNYVKCIE